MGKMDVCEILKVIGHPVRLKMLMGIRKDECSVSKIVDSLGLPQSTVSQHLGIMKRAGIITPRKEGVKTCYCINNEFASAILELIREEER